MLLAGIALAALAGACGLLIFVSRRLQLRELTFWSLGSLAGATWEKVAVPRSFHPGRARRLRALRAISTPSCSAKPRRGISAWRSRGQAWLIVLAVAARRRRRRGRLPARSASSASSCRICCGYDRPDHRTLSPPARCSAPSAAARRRGRPAPSSRRRSCRSASSPLSSARRSSSGCCSAAARCRASDVLSARDVAVSLGGRLVLRGVNLALSPGEVTALSARTAPENRRC